MKRFAVIAAAAVIAVVGFAAPAPAEASGATTVTFTLTGGALTIAAPASANLGSGLTGSSNLSGQLGPVTVTDARGATLGSWTASVVSTDFTTGGGTSNETIPKADIVYASGAATATTGVGVFTPGQLTIALGQALSQSRTAYAATGVVGNNTVTWNPTVQVNVPAAAVTGTYTGTVTHSVA